MLFPLPFHPCTCLPHFVPIFLFAKKCKVFLFKKTGQGWCSTTFIYCMIPLLTQTVDYFQYWAVRACYQGLHRCWYHYKQYKVIEYYLHRNGSAALLIFFYLYHLKKIAEKNQKDSERSLMCLISWQEVYWLAAHKQFWRLHPLKQLNWKSNKNVNNQRTETKTNAANSQDQVSEKRKPLSWHFNSLKYFRQWI